MVERWYMPVRSSRQGKDPQSRTSRTAAAAVKTVEVVAECPAGEAEPAADGFGAAAIAGADAGRAEPCSPSAAAACSSGRRLIEGNSSFGLSQSQIGANRSGSWIHPCVRA